MCGAKPSATFFVLQQIFCAPENGIGNAMRKKLGHLQATHAMSAALPALAEGQTRPVWIQRRPVVRRFARVYGILALLCVLVAGQNLAWGLGPVILTQPSSVSITNGNSATFSVGALGASSYQWYFNSNILGGATGASYTVTNAAATNAGNYFVVASNVGGNTTSSVATLTVWLSATVTLSNLTQAYNGLSHSVTVTTVPTNVTVSVTYNGLSSLPVNAGFYLVAATVTSSNYTGGATNILTILQTLTVTGITASNKVYDGTTAASVNMSNAVLVGVLGLDLITISGTATGAFNTPVVGTNKIVSISGLSLLGLNAGAYLLATPVATANITPANSILSLASSLNPAAGGSNVTFTAGVSSTGGGQPTGSVIFMDGSAVLGTNNINSGVATLATSLLSHGHHTIAGLYNGDGNFYGSSNSVNQLIDSPPAAASVALQRTVPAAVKIRIAALLAYDSDPDNDTISFVSSSTNSTAGATIASNGSWLFYVPSAGFTNADNFSYTIADSQGLTATGSVSISIPLDLSFARNIDSMTNSIIGQPTIRFDEISGRSCTVQYATNLTTPNWQVLSATVADALGKFDYTDVSAPVPNPRFYRTTIP
jgi:hypothetical protein